MCASWFLESTYLMWILGSKLMLSHIQSREILWVLETCFRVGHMPLIILITASSSSKIYSIAPLWEEFKMSRVNLRVTL